MICGFDEKRLDQIRKHAIERIDSKRLLGACSGVYRGNELVWKSCEGYSRTDGTPLNIKSMFRLASMSKPITTVAVMIQCERGYLRLTDPISRFLPEFEHMSLADGTPANPIEIRHLLSHCSGLGQDDFGMREFLKVAPKKGDTLATTIPRYAKMLLPYQPGLHSTYSGVVGIDILARIVEITSGKVFSKFLQDEIFDPLGMVDTTFHPSDEQRKRLVEFCKADGVTIEPIELKTNVIDIPLSYESGSTALLGTLDDYLRFARMLLNKGKLDGVRIISPRTVEQMRSPAMSYQTTPEHSDLQWGLGVRIVTHLNGYSAPLSVGSFGWSGSYGTHFFIDPVLNIAAVYMSNWRNAGGAGAPTAFEFENDVISAIVEE